MKENTTATNVSIDYSENSLNELLTIFKEMLDRKDQQELYKNFESIKAAFYKVLKREKLASGVFVGVGQPENQELSNSFDEVEKAFKELHEQYKVIRNAYLKEEGEKREENYLKKRAIIEQIDALCQKAEDMNQTLPAFRELQKEWKELGSVPVEKARSLIDDYNRSLELFYDYIKINKDFRDFDFKKNLEAKTLLCEKAEALLTEKDIISAFNQLQHLHDEWKELGPVAKSERESIWERFKTATSLINKKHQEYFDKLKESQKNNLLEKTQICEEAEKLVAQALEDSKEWNRFSKQLEQLQQKWKTIGFASKKDNQKIYDRFRASCDAFYNAKREYYSNFKDVLEENLKKKEELCVKAEELKESTDWKNTTDKLISLQKQWKEIGPVARKQSDAIWKRFRAACDEFFNNKSKNLTPEEESYKENLEAKRELIEQIKSFVPSEDKEANKQSLTDFLTKWATIGFVPMREKESIDKQFDAVLDLHFADIRDKVNERKINKLHRYINDVKSQGKGDRTIRYEREKLLNKFRKKQTDLATLENNMGFFAKSKNADKLISQMQVKIEEYKKELSQLEQQIKSIDNTYSNE